MWMVMVDLCRYARSIETDRETPELDEIDSRYHPENIICIALSVCYLGNTNGEKTMHT
jgi:hypothetical protein